ncbi:MAG: hypothetical protein U0797_06360 [Gemmataceae bacterium]
MAHVAALQDKGKDFAAKHIIIISDGDPMQNNKALLNQVRADRITIATVGVATHGRPGGPEDVLDIASPIRGTNRSYYKVTDPAVAGDLHQVRWSARRSSTATVRAARLVMKTGPTARLPELLPLGGFVRTTPKASPLVEVPILSPKFADQDFPVLAYWNYGLGAAVFTSDAGQPEFPARRWLAGGGGREGVFAGFWEQVLGWALRPVESGRLVMNTEARDGKVRIVVEARGPDGKPDTDAPAGRPRPGPAGKRQRCGSPRRTPASTRRRSRPRRRGRTSSPPRRRGCGR